MSRARTTGARRHFDGLCRIATGAAPRTMLPIVRSEASKGVLRAAHLRGQPGASRRAARGSRQVVVIGGGWIGGEVAAACRSLVRSRRARCIEALDCADDALTRAWSRARWMWAAELHRAHGVDVRLGIERRRRSPAARRDSVAGVVLADGTPSSPRGRARRRGRAPRRSPSGSRARNRTASTTAWSARRRGWHSAPRTSSPSATWRAGTTRCSIATCGSSTGRTRSNRRTGPRRPWCTGQRTGGLIAVRRRAVLLVGSVRKEDPIRRRRW